MAKYWGLSMNASFYFQTVTSVLRWMIKLERIDIITKVPILLLHVALPREGHLEVAVNVIAYVGERYNSRLVYDPSFWSQCL